MASSTRDLLQQAVSFHRGNRLIEAERFYRQALKQDPTNFDVLYLFGMLTMQRGEFDEAAALTAAAVKRNPASVDALMLLGSLKLAQSKFEEALGCFDQAVKHQPKNLDVRYNLAVALEAAGRLPQALEEYDRVVIVQPQSAAAWFNRGNVLARLFRYEDALASYDRALALEPGWVDALNNRGKILTLLHRHDDAVAMFDRVLARVPTHVEALCGRSVSLLGLWRVEDALESADRALRLQPDHVIALLAKANSLLALENWDAALAQYDRVLTLSPGDVEAIANRALCLIELQKFDEALAEAERALAMRPDYAVAHCARAHALKEVGRYEAADSAFQKAVSLRPDSADVRLQYGLMLQALERHAEALENFEKALAIRPRMVNARWCSSSSYLSLGRFAEGWQNYEYRWESTYVSGLVRRDYRQPQWDGASVPGVLLVWAEQGVGEQILFSSLVQEARRHCERLVLEVDPRLMDLFARSLKDIDVVPLGTTLYSGGVDVQTPMGSLPKQILKNWNDFPKREGGFLVPRPQQVQSLRERLASDGRRVVGLTWLSRNPKVGRFKSAQLRDFAALLKRPGYRFIDLQYGDTSQERAEVKAELGIEIEHLNDIDNRDDLDGHAALIAACDVVFTVSNTTAHLAGAVGTPTWVMLPFGRGRFWYWFAGQPTSPWYPRTQVRRQRLGQLWADLVTELVPEIEEASARPWQPRGAN